MTDLQGAGFTRVPTWLTRKVSPTAVVVFTYLAEYGTWSPATGRYVNVRPSQLTLAKVSGMSRRTVQRAMDELHHAGALEREAQIGTGGQEPSACTLYVGFTTEASTESEAANTARGYVTHDAPDQIGPPASPMTQGGASPMTQGLASPGVTHDAGGCVTHDAPGASPMTHNPKEPTYHPGATTHSGGREDQDHLKLPDDLDLSRHVQTAVPTDDLDLSAPPTRQDPLPLPAVGLVGIQRTIMEKLAGLRLPAVEQDARDIHTRVRGLAWVKDCRRAVLALTSDQLRGHFEAVRQERADAFEASRVDMADCPHGDCGGDVPHPVTGLPSCVLCQHGAPPILRPAHDPAVERAVAAWARAYPGRPNPLVLGRAYRQIVQVLNGGIPADELENFAAAAGAKGQDPLTYAAKIDNYMSQGSAQ